MRSRPRESLTGPTLESNRRTLRHPPQYADTDSDIKDLYFCSDKTYTTKVHDINRLKAIIGPEICSQLLFIHAFTGCDSTSRIFGIGKKTAFKKLVKGQLIIKECANCFILPNQTDHIIKDLGNKAMTVMFGNDGSSIYYYLLKLVTYHN